MPEPDKRGWSNDQIAVKDSGKIVGIIQRKAVDQGDVAANAIYPKYEYTSLRLGRVIYAGTGYGSAVDAFQYRRLQDRGAL